VIVADSAFNEDSQNAFPVGGATGVRYTRRSVGGTSLFGEEEVQGEVVRKSSGRASALRVFGF